MGVTNKEARGSIDPPRVSVPEKKKKRKKQQKQKDPADVLSYLEVWKTDRSTWKFNKNTQSWLIRHMYQADKLNKTGFSWMVEYLQEGPDGLKHRVVRDATRRAVRYQEYAEQQPAVDSPKEKDDKAKTEEKGGGGNPDGEGDVWEDLSDHDKRKEYKRARKVLEVLAATAASKSGTSS